MKQWLVGCTQGKAKGERIGGTLSGTALLKSFGSKRLEEGSGGNGTLGRTEEDGKVWDTSAGGGSGRRLTARGLCSREGIA